ncbi:adenylyltransferase/sulfurtransferase [Anaerosolibacter carboniphilus]|uniref:Adenylyltransferase/sulfurtransferase n=1 Tax=Anaerosolibacter carboniphilus TaxID=1417629 RepID=A0A841KN32_9FIRM|nr:adenylyltransferase/sulfurtransferase [Anaerosolibacter carboniphilus]
MERYAKQVLFDKIGKHGQEKLLASKVVIIGCGALGTVIANNLARTGVGYIKIVDRDYIELSNLQRQILFDEEDMANSLPKAIAAQNKLRKINSDIAIDGVITDVNPKNIIEICKGMDLILDATDNFNIRYLINDVSIKLDIPWIYGGAVGSMGMTHTIVPGVTPCFRCIMPEIPPAGAIDTCDTVGVLNSIINIVASFQTTEAIKLLIGEKEELVGGVRFIDVWNNDFETIEKRKKENCLACSQNQLEFLDHEAEDAVYLCGKDSVQVNPMNKEISADRLIQRLEASDINIKKNQFYIKFQVEDVQVTLFYDGRAILKNISDVNQAKSFYARYIGL